MSREEWQAQYRDQRLADRSAARSKRKEELQYRIRRRQEEDMKSRIREEQKLEELDEKRKKYDSDQASRRGTFGIGILVALLRASYKELKEQSNTLNELNKTMGGTTGANTLYLGGKMSEQAAYENAQNAKNMFASTNNSLHWLVTAFKKVATALVSASDTFKEAAQVVNQQMQTLAQMQGAQTGLSYTASGKAYTTSRNIALRRMKELYPDREEADLLSDALYTQIYSSVLNAVLHGGAIQNTSLSTEGWEGWAFEELGWNPNVDYSNEALADARRRYLEMLASLGNDEEAAERMKYYRNQSRLLKTIAGQLFSFDEVETQQAISMADTVDAVEDFGAETTEALRDEEDLWQELIQKYGLTQQQIDNIKRLMDATGISLIDIKALLESGVKFDDATTNSIIRLMNATGISVNDIVRLLEAGVQLDATTVDKLIAAYNKGLNTTDIINAIKGLGLDVFFDMNTTIEDILKWLKDHPFTDEGTSKENDGKIISVDERRAQADAMQQEMDERFSDAIGQFGGKDPNEDKTGYIGPNRNDNSTNRSILEASQQAAHRNTTNAQALDSINALLDNSHRSSLGAAFATGGIGTSKVTNATLFENGPEAVIPLSSDLGKQFMADALSKATDGNANIGGDTININIDGPTILNDDHSLTKLATLVGDTYTQVKARRGGQ